MKVKLKTKTFLVSLLFISLSLLCCHKKMGHSGDITSIDFSPNGEILASGSEDFGKKNDFIKLWDVKTGKEIKTLQGHSTGVTSVDFSPDGEILTSGGRDNTIRLWNVKTGKEIKTLQGHSSDVTSVDFSPNGEILASGSRDGFIKLWDVKTGKDTKTLKGHPTGVTSVDFSPNGEILASGGRDGFIKLWDIETGEDIRTLRGPSLGVMSIKFSSDGKTLTSGGKDNQYIRGDNLQLWNVDTANKIEAFWTCYGNVYSIAFHPNNKILASAGEGRFVKIWNLEMCEEIKNFRVNRSTGVSSVNFSPDGKIIASASGKSIRLGNFQTQKINTNLTKFYNEDFNNDIFSSQGPSWIRFQADKNQIFINKKNELELKFDKKEWTGTYYKFPNYVAKGVYEFIIIAKAEKQNSRIDIYDPIREKMLFFTKINTSKEFKQYFFRVKMPSKENHTLWLYFHQSNKEEIGGKLIIRELKIALRHLSKGKNH